jgi:hypothetical protein
MREIVVQKNSQPEFEVEFKENSCSRPNPCRDFVQNFSHLGAFGRQKRRITLSLKFSSFCYRSPAERFPDEFASITAALGGITFSGEEERRQTVSSVFAHRPRPKVALVPKS